MKKLSQKGFSLPEVLLAAAILAFTLCGILATYVACFKLITISKNASIATATAQGLLEEIRATPFPQITTMQLSVGGTTYSPSISSCNSNLSVWNFPYNMPLNSRVALYVDDTLPDRLQVTISVCWRQGTNVIGEDTNLNGVLNAGEDKNGNCIIDSTVELVTYIVNR
jgi:prepilin-type N-terminal cleavage/methylation domain-containing protein